MSWSSLELTLFLTLPSTSSWFFRSVEGNIVNPLSAAFLDNSKGKQLNLSFTTCSLDSLDSPKSSPVVFFFASIEICFTPSSCRGLKLSSSIRNKSSQIFSVPEWIMVWQAIDRKNKGCLDGKSLVTLVSSIPESEPGNLNYFSESFWLEIRLLRALKTSIDQINAHSQIDLYFIFSYYPELDVMFVWL